MWSPPLLVRGSGRGRRSLRLRARLLDLDATSAHETDERGRVKLSMKALIERPEPVFEEDDNLF